MASSQVFILFLLFCAQLIFGEERINGLSKATTQLGFDILKANGNATENVFFSPASISACVGMVFAGSAGKTKSQIKNAMYNDQDDQTVYDQMKNLSDILNKPSKSYNLSIANRLYAQNKFDILQSYLKTLKDSFQSELTSVDFATKSESVRKDINDWVENKTNHKIKDMFPKDSLTGAVLVLVNAIYFKGTWKDKFKESNTAKKTFFTNENKKGDIDMMKQTSHEFYYKEDDDVQLLGLPYTGDQLTMFVILPKKRFGLGQIESKLSGDRFQSLIHDAEKREIQEVQIPKFKLEKELGLDDILKSLGMTDMFTTNADLSGIDGKRDLTISKALHKAFVEVNEKGTEAAASTGIVAVPTSLLIDTRPPVKFIADQPFLFAILEGSTKNPLFLGRFVGN